MTAYHYQGEELRVFEHAVNWKRYFKSVISQHLTGDVLEVGAGLGGTTRVLCDGRQRSWTCLEPDPELAALAEKAVTDDRLLPLPIVRTGTVDDLGARPTYDAIIYIDVLEHIEDDRRELATASRRLKPGGVIVVLCPAHQFLFTEFDKRIGHFRRYDRRMFRALTPSGTVLERLRYLDCAGLVVSAANRFLLRSGTPTVAQVRLWDRYFVSFSRVADRLIGWHLGKSVLGVWRRTS